MITTSTGDTIWIVIPAYWGPADLGIYDHPTPLDGESTLPRLLDSLTALETDTSFRVLVLVSAVAPEYEKAASARVRKMLSDFQQSLDLYLADAQTAALVSDVLSAEGLDAQVRGLRGYGAVRNMQLLIPAALGADVIIALDDDEAVEADYLKHALKWIGQDTQGHFVGGIAGPYLDEQGSPYIAEPARVQNILRDKSTLMNKEMRHLMANPKEIKQTSLALGGNMVFHRALFSKVGFDPAIPRGEDIDYVINARLAGFDFYFDANPAITHLPPRHYEAPAYAKLRQDVIRFIYEQEKLRLAGHKAAEFGIYPGRLLQADFIPAAKQALEEAATPTLTAQYGTPMEIIQAAQAYATEKAPQYFDFAEDLPNFILSLKQPFAVEKLAKSIAEPR